MAGGVLISSRESLATTLAPGVSGIFFVFFDFLFFDFFLALLPFSLTMPEEEPLLDLFPGSFSSFQAASSIFHSSLSLSASATRASLRSGSIFFQRLAISFAISVTLLASSGISFATTALSSVANKKYAEAGRFGLPLSLDDCPSVIRGVLDMALPGLVFATPPFFQIAFSAHWSKAEQADRGLATLEVGLLKVVIVIFVEPA